MKICIVCECIWLYHYYYMGQSHSTTLVCSHHLRDGSYENTYDDGRTVLVTRNGHKSTIKGTCVSIKKLVDCGCRHRIKNWSDWRCNENITNVITYKTDGTRGHILDDGFWSLDSISNWDPVPLPTYVPVDDIPLDNDC